MINPIASRSSNSLSSIGGYFQCVHQCHTTIGDNWSKCNITSCHQLQVSIPPGKQPICIPIKCVNTPIPEPHFDGFLGLLMVQITTVFRTAAEERWHTQNELNEEGGKDKGSLQEVVKQPE